MAKESMKAREAKRLKLVERYAAKRAALKAEGDYIGAEIYAENREGIQEAINELNKKLPSYKQIQKVTFRDTEFEKTTTKKIKRKYN